MPADGHARVGTLDVGSAAAGSRTGSALGFEFGRARGGRLASRDPPSAS